MKKCLTLFLLLFAWMGVRAQSLAPTVIANSGEFFSNSAGQLSWTLGEISTETFSGGSNILTQGFQQTNLTVTSVNQIETAAMAVNVYPNPTADFVNLSFADQSNGNVLVELFDSEGQLIYSEARPVSGSGDIIRVDMQGRASGVYMLKVTFPGETAPRNFKIQKIN